MIKKLKGFLDKWNLDVNKNQLIINFLNDFAIKSNFNSLILPTVELEDVFSKTLGNTSDIVQKEFFSIKSKDKNNKNIVLRPELTSNVIRAVLESKLLNSKKPFNVFTFGNCFRYENPQKGRYREFYQWSLEQILTDNNNYLKIFSFLNLILEFFKIKKFVTLKINYISLNQLKNIRSFFSSISDEFKLCNFCLERKKQNNVFRILDCKIDGKNLSKKINLIDFLTSNDKKRYTKIKKDLSIIFQNLQIIEDKNLTRGLDYYDGIIFELSFNSNEKWAKNVILAGGEYLLNAFSDKFKENEKGIGFAIGIERFLISLDEISFFEKNNFFNDEKVAISFLKEDFKYNALKLQNELINSKYFVINNLKPISFLKSLEKNLKKDIKWMIFFGNEYIKEKKVLIKKIYKHKEEKIQFISSLDGVIEILKNN